MKKLLLLLIVVSCNEAQTQPHVQKVVETIKCTMGDKSEVSNHPKANMGFHPIMENDTKPTIECSGYFVPEKCIDLCKELMMKVDRK